MTNRHLLAAMVAAPLLSIAGWWVAGEIGRDQPAPAQRGESYPLVEKSNCRYASGSCDLENAELKLTLTYVEEPPEYTLLVHSSHALAGVLVSVEAIRGDSQPLPMKPVPDTEGVWRIALAGRPAPQDRLRLVASASGSVYFAESGTRFLQPDGVGAPTP